MPAIPLSSLATLIREGIDTLFAEHRFWVIAETADVRLMPDKRWAFLKVLEKKGSEVVCDMQMNVWSQGFQAIKSFEKQTGQPFKSGIRIACEVKVVFHERYGLRLELLALDAAFTTGHQIIQRQETLHKLLREHPHTVRLVDGEYETANKKLRLPRVLQRVALIASEGTDGYRDFVRELTTNKHGFGFQITHFPARVQGDQASADLLAALQQIHPISSSFDVLVMVRGGGSDTDFAPFDDYDVCRMVAAFPIPVFTGIGHDRNTSIADLMGWQWKTPTKAAAAIADTAFVFQHDLLQLSNRMQQAVASRIAGQKTMLQASYSHISRLAQQRISGKRLDLIKARISISTHALDQVSGLKHRLHHQQHLTRVIATQKITAASSSLLHLRAMVDQLDPRKVLQRGYALVRQQQQVVTRIQQVDEQNAMEVQLFDGTIISSIKSIKP